MAVRPTIFLASAALGLAFSSAGSAQQGDGTRVAISTAINKPAKVPATPERVAQINVPSGFTVAPFATGLKNARILAVAANGDIYLSRRDQGDVLLLRDTDGDGKADGAPVTVANRAQAHGLAIHDGKLYLVTVKELFVADILTDGRLGPMTLLAGDLPDSGQHANRTIAWGPDNMLYLSVGSTCNACNESNPENATILRVSPDGKSRTIFASGLRNTIGFDWDPATGALWGLDHGIDFLGDDDQPEELNRIEQGKKYGWPHVYASGRIYPQSTPVGDISKEDWKATSEPMVLGYTGHAAPMQLVFYSAGAFPAEFNGNAFATMRGSWNRATPSGYEIVRIRFASGKPTAIEPFVTGFLTDNGTSHFARPVGLAVAKDGALLMADDANGVIYRIAYQNGRARAAGDSPAPVTEMQRQTSVGLGVPLASARPETAARGSLRIMSQNFTAGRPIPLKQSEYADGVSPQLSWTPVPGAVSYALIMEDPDAHPITPFVHWLAWNIPAATTALPEGLQEQPRLTEPNGVLQGRTSRGSAGYYGPRPPVGDPPHHYHVQLLALDTMVDVPAGADREMLLAAVKGHVLAKGELIGTYQQMQAPPK
ncbi:YbhB/YbcL family Raf kinase inhibitor-like protein [Sphingomonas crocodyli]|uniref:YbhB/YbcL family Raf kinase inhibitor-like protein n=1 Tax=Sphingomonas crocodyli TaxID=1979270 RepID=UPI001F0C4531|nr:YbhB/YbcL family Raf kinase inhibitor-like protein [Sphingomonas crocodyli]